MTAANAPASQDGPAISVFLWQPGAAPGMWAWPGRYTIIRDGGGRGRLGRVFWEAALRGMGLVAAHDGTRVIG